MTVEQLTQRLDDLELKRRELGNDLRACQKLTPTIIRTLVKHLGCTRKELARRLGISNVWLSYLEHSHKTTTIEIFQHMLKILTMG